MQIFKLNPVYYPESAEKIIPNLQVLIEKYPIWSRHKLNLARFLVPAECSPQDHKVFIVFSSKTDLNVCSTEPDSFFKTALWTTFATVKLGTEDMAVVHMLQQLYLVQGSQQKKRQNSNINENEIY